jgi:predicted tellurium resistance membrane protein TerC
MEQLLLFDTWIALVSLAAMEIVLGIDNIVFISILVAKLPPEKREKIRKLGIGLALGARLGLLFTLSWMMRLEEPLIHVFGYDFSGRDLILLGGGLFLTAKATFEIHSKLEGGGEHAGGKSAVAAVILVQILLLDIVFSLDSVITAVGMVKQLWIMVTAMLIAVAVMLIFAKRIGDFIDRHPSLKVLALSFLLLIGVMLVAEGLGQHIEKGYIYFAMAFSFLVELLNMRRTRKQRAIHLRSPYEQP